MTSEKRHGADRELQYLLNSALRSKLKAGVDSWYSRVSSIFISLPLQHSLSFHGLGLGVARELDGFLGWNVRWKILDISCLSMPGNCERKRWTSPGLHSRSRIEECIGFKVDLIEVAQPPND